MGHLIWVLIVCKNTGLGVSISIIQRGKLVDPQTSQKQYAPSTFTKLGGGGGCFYSNTITEFYSTNCAGILDFGIYCNVKQQRLM